jgi:hypothetical protein
MTEITGKKIISGTLSSIPEAQLITEMMGQVQDDETRNSGEQEASYPKPNQDSDETLQ